MFIVQSPPPSALPKRPFSGASRRLFTSPAAPRRLVKRLKSKRPGPGTRIFAKGRRPMPRLQTPTPTVVNNYYYGTAAPKKTIIPRQLTISKPHHITQHFRPSSANVQLTNSTTGSYNATEGLLLGPSATATGDMFFTIRFTIADLSQVSTFSGVFDAYRIDRVDLQFNPVQNVMGNQPLQSIGDPCPQDIITVIDYDDVVLPALETELEEYETYARSAGYERHYRTLVPAIAKNVHRTGGLNIGYMQEKEKFIDFQYTDVEHYGIKGMIRSVDNGFFDLNNYRIGYYLVCKMYLTLRQTK